jgi:uncharacterized protein (DUF1800 family)
MKRPLVLVASTVRALGLEAQPELAAYRDFLSLLGEGPYAAVDPRGYPDDSALWVAPGSLLGRLQFLQWAAFRASAAGRDFGVTGAEPSAELVARLAEQLGLRALSDAEAAPVVAYVERLLAFPAETRRVEAAGLVLSSSRFLTH